MMKKNGFTLAEVLITLAIIGVVATMTLPALMSNTGEQQAKTAVKKIVSVLTTAANSNLAVENFDYSTLGANGFGDLDQTDREMATVNEQSLAYIFYTNLAIDYGKTDGKRTTPITKSPLSSAQTVYLQDGSSITFPKGETMPEGWNSKEGTTDDLVKGFTVIYDMNGDKAPNILSNCKGISTGGADNPNAAGTEEDPASNCGKKGQKVIKDQFQLQLRGTVVQPYGAAAEYAYNK